jgi:BolA protein
MQVTPERKIRRRHYRLDIESPEFAGRRLMERHRIIYTALGDLMQHDIHALSITARAPGEARPE